MTLLSARADALVDQIEKLSRLKQAAQRLKEYQQRRDRLERALDALRPPARFIALLEKRGISVAPVSPPSTVETAIVQARNLAGAYNVDSSVILGNDFGSLIKTLGIAREQLASRARMSWKDYSGPLAKAISGELLDALERIDSFRATVQSIRSFQTPMEGLAAKDWVEEHELDSFSALLEQRTKAWDELQAGSAIPEEVVEFLKQCHKDGVRLDAVKPETVEWLRGRGILACFRIVL